jgi:hypothetical protein
MESCAGLQVTLCNDNEWTLPPLLFTFLRNPPPLPFATYRSDVRIVVGRTRRSCIGDAPGPL